MERVAAQRPTPAGDIEAEAGAKPVRVPPPRGAGDDRRRAVRVHAAPPLEPGLAKEALTRFILAQVGAAGAAGVVVGLSGGIDSAVTATLCAAAVGSDKVLGVLLPSPHSEERDIQHAREVAEGLAIELEILPLAGLIQAYTVLAAAEGGGRVREGNFTARLRMALLYDRSARDGFLVAGTGNKTEILLGYTTLWGDMAAAFTPLGDLYKTQVRELACYLGVPQAICDKPPSAGLWAGQTDEEELGATYAELDSLLYHYVDLRYDIEGLVEAGLDRKSVV